MVWQVVVKWFDGTTEILKKGLDKKALEAYIADAAKYCGDMGGRVNLVPVEG